MPVAALPSPAASRLAAGLGLALFAGALFAQAAPPPPGPTPHPTLHVGLADSPPFSKFKDGRWSGVSVDLWSSVAASLGETVTWSRVSPADAPALLAARRIDVGPAMAMSTEAVRAMDFSPPILASGLSIATSEDQGWDFQAILASLWDSRLANLIGGIVLVNVIAGFVLWRLERRSNPAVFGGEASQGFASGVWCAVSTMTTVGYGDKVPITWPGRLLCFIMMLSGVVVISLLTATASSALTVAHLRPRVHDAGDLKSAVSAVVAGSAGADYLQTQGLRMLPCPDAAAAEAALERGRAAAFVDDRIQLRTWYHDHPHGIAILPLTLQEVYYAYPLLADPADRRRLAVALQDFLDSSEWQKLQTKHFAQ